MHANQLTSVPASLCTAKAMTILQLQARLCPPCAREGLGRGSGGPGEGPGCWSPQNAHMHRHNELHIPPSPAQTNKLTSLPDADYPASLQTVFVQENVGLASMPKGLLKATGISRLNVGTGVADTDEIVVELKKMVLGKGPKAMFWGTDGKCVTGS